jgi:hypothetical protein
MKQEMLTFSRVWMVMVIVVASLSSTGCNQRESWQAVTYPASGTFMVNGQPAEGAVVMLEPTTGFVDRRQSRPWASVTSSGQFKLTTYENGDGAPEGEYKILLVWPTHGTLEQKDRLNGKYGMPENPYAVVTIKPGKNELPPVDLKDVQITK